MKWPGATISGLMRPSGVGPRLEKVATWQDRARVSAGSPVRLTMRGCYGEGTVLTGIKVAVAPTVITFLPIAGLPMLASP